MSVTSIKPHWQPRCQFPAVDATIFPTNKSKKKKLTLEKNHSVRDAVRIEEGAFFFISSMAAFLVALAGVVARRCAQAWCQSAQGSCTVCLCPRGRCPHRRDRKGTNCRPLQISHSPKTRASRPAVRTEQRRRGERGREGGREGERGWRWKWEMRNWETRYEAAPVSEIL